MWIVTGATGFIGSALIWELNRHGEKNILAVDHVPPSERPEILKKRAYARFIQADKLFDELEDSALARSIKGVFHMGACSSTTETDEDFLRRNNIEYSQSAWEFCARMNIPLIYASSGACYGDGTKGFDDARNPADFTPLNLYGWSKLKFDIWAMTGHPAPPRWCGLRFFNVYGPNEYHKGEMSSVAFKAFNQIRATGRLRLFRSHHPDYRDGEQLRDFVYVKDIVRWMREMMETPSVASGIYNMGFGKARSWLDLAKNTFANVDQPLEIDWIEIPANIRNQYQYFTEAKMDRLFAQKLSRPQWSLEKGIADYVNSYLKQEDPYL
ncbi:MAG: ADP-glyceromanno-heptose 6-epimerase [Calothrix sp. SM1_5_4]|nr:ADP-glyceromanno-heptose 6-epimerase [Calothrix sp. SM1_5_4]